MTKKEAEPLFRKNQLFRGWTPEQIFAAIKSAFQADPQKLTQLLDRGFDGWDEKILQEKWKTGFWSYGYCYYVAEVAHVMFLGSGIEEPFQLLRYINEQKTDGLEDRLDKHFVLRHNDKIFDPEQGPNCSVEEYQGFQPVQFQPQHPSINAVLLLIWVVENHEKYKSNKTLTETIRPILREVADWKPGGQKENLKKLIWKFTGRS